ncbi:MAG: hypothetical protein ACI8QC_000482 [Planctomycetota bacterium]|jgi:hypothetical protein
MRQSKAAFTIVEVLLTVSIMGLMMVAITQLLTSVRVTRDRIHNIQETQMAGPVIVDMIVRDLYAIHVADRAREFHLRVQDRVEYGLDADRIDFVTSTDAREAMLDGERQLRADLCEVGYVTRVRPDDDEFLELFRREAFGVDENPFHGGNYTFLTDRVKSLAIDVYTLDGPDEEPLQEWGLNQQDTETHGLPAWIEIRLTLENAPRLLREQIERSSRERATVTYIRTIRFPEGLRYEEDEDVPRFGIPQRPAEGSGEGEEEEGDNIAQNPDDFTNTLNNQGRGDQQRSSPTNDSGKSKPVTIADPNGNL